MPGSEQRQGAMGEAKGETCRGLGDQAVGTAKGARGLAALGHGCAIGRAGLMNTLAAIGKTAGGSKWRNAWPGAQARKRRSSMIDTRMR
jgi:hypothetical protein